MKKLAYILVGIIISGIAYAQNFPGLIPTNSLLGRDTTGTGQIESILLDDSLELDGSKNLQRSALTGDVTAAAGGNATTIAGNSVALTTDTTGNYVLDVADGTGIDGTASGEGTTYNPTLDLTEINSTTFGSGTFTTLTFNAGAVDPIMTFGSGTLDLSALTTLGLDDEGEFRLFEEDAGGANYKGFKAPTALTASTTCTLEDDANFIPDSCVGDGTDANTLGSDGDKGDITVGGTGTTLAIDAGAVNDTALAASAVDGGAAGEIADGSITADDLGTDSVAADEIAAAAVGTSEAAALDTGDITTGAFVDARVDGSLEADEVNPTLGTQTTGNYQLTTAAGAGIAVTGADAEGSTKTIALDYSDAGADPALAADACRFTNDTTSSGEIVCEGDTADTFETRIVVTEPTADRSMTIPNADSVATQPLTCGGTDKVSAISALGVVTCSADAGAGGGISNIVEDLTPQLGGTLDTNGFAIEFGTAATDTSVVRSAAGNLTIEGNVIYRAGGTDVPVTDGGTGASALTDLIALTTHTTGNYAAGDAEAGAALTGDTATAFFSAGTIESARMAAALDTAQGACELATTAEAETGTDTTRCVTAAGVLAAVVGKRTIYVPAGAMISETTTGCATGTVESVTNLVMYKVLDCDGATQEGVQFTFKMPKNADEGTVTMALDWTAASGSGDTVWLFSCLARSDDDVLDTAFGSEISVTDTVLTVLDLHTTAESAAITAGGTPAESDMWWCRVQRDADAAGDTLNALDARILGARILYATNAYTDD